MFCSIVYAQDTNMPSIYRDANAKTSKSTDTTGGLKPAPSISLKDFKEQENSEKVQKLMDLKAIQWAFFKKDRKLSDNNFNILYVAGNTNKIRLRYAMTTLFIFDNDPIVYVSLGDPSGFEISYPTNEHYSLNNLLVIKPLLIGVDTNLTVIGASGRIYTFYIFSVHFTSPKQSYFTVFVSNRRQIGALQLEAFKTTPKNSSTPSDYKKLDYSSKEYDDEKYIKIGDPVNHIFIEKAKISRGYVQKPRAKRKWWSLWLYKKPNDDAVAMKALDIFDDSKYTYFRFDRDLAISKFPYTYKVVDGYDNPINSRVVGNYIIAEDVGRKWTLRLGAEYVCVVKNQKAFKKSKDFAKLKELLEKDEAMKARRNNLHLVEEENIPQLILSTPVKPDSNQTCTPLSTKETKALENIKKFVAPKFTAVKRRPKFKRKYKYCIPIESTQRKNNGKH
ncbi:TrbG/VirB9 family P-type conjugative transfer protein [Helicobacter suis]|uniref:TrbG/VirB9 family P-type conjugative transfer protein n=1 Tax=Helicobacter suis TaxID=104628 RepID=UPI000CF178C8|nr:TrbG/VirB9 family P-type conjugative transfer protein [Helicobacter suis]